MSDKASGAITRHVEIRYHEGEFFVERADGTMTVALHVERAVDMVREDDRKIVKRKRRSVITRIDWIGMPTFIVADLKKLQHESPEYK